MLTRTITFTVDSHDVTPTVPQYGGVKGEHNAALLSVTVTGGLIAAEDTVRLSFTLGDGAVVSSDWLDVTVDDTRASVSYLLPRLLTESGHQLRVRLVVSTIDADGVEQVTYRSGEMVVWFEDAECENGTPFWTGVSEMLVRTATAAAEAKVSAEEAALSEETAMLSQRAAASSAAAAKTDADAVKEAVLTTNTLSTAAGTARDEAVSAAAQAKTHSENAADSAAQAQDTLAQILADNTLCYRGENPTIKLTMIAASGKAAVGDVYRNTDEECLVLWNGTEWLPFGSAADSDTVTDEKLAAAVETYLIENPVEAGEDGDDGVSVTHSWNGTVLTVTSASGTSSADLKGDKGDTGATGAQGEKGDKGDTGATGADGQDYILTEDDKAEIAEQVPLVTVPAEPLFADGVAAMTDTAQVYVNTETGTLWRYAETTYEATLTDVIAMDDADNPAHDGYYINKGTLTTKTDSFVTPYINIGKYSGQIALKVKGATCLSDAATVYYCADLCDGNRTYLSRVYMTLAEAKGTNVVTILCDSLDKVTVDGDTTTFIIDLPRVITSGAAVHNIRFSCVGDLATTAISVDYQATVTEKIWVDTGIAYAPTVTEADKAAIAQEVAAMVDAELLSILGDGEVTV